MRSHNSAATFAKTKTIARLVKMDPKSMVPLDANVWIIYSLPDSLLRNFLACWVPVSLNIHPRLRTVRRASLPSTFRMATRLTSTWRSDWEERPAFLESTFLLMMRPWLANKAPRTARSLGVRSGGKTSESTF